MFNNNKKINLTFYIKPDKAQELESAIEISMPEFKNVKIWSPKNYFDETIMFWKSLKIQAKNTNHKFLAKIFHLIMLLTRIAFIIPRKLVNLKNNKKINFNIFLSPVFKIPDFLEKNTKIKKYTIIYDTIPILFPELYGYNKRTVYNFWRGKLVKFMVTNNSDKYFAISESAANDFLKLVPGLKKEQIIVTPLACSNNFHPCDKEHIISVLKKYNLPTDKKYVFSLCSLEPRKNLIRAVKTFVQFLKKNNIDDMVFILGGGHWKEFIGKLDAEIDSLGDYKDKIIKAGYIDDEDLALLYSGAEWFVYTSQYEGFCLSPLEAMACGTPVITSNNSSLPEVVGKAGIMIDWDSDEQHIAAYEKYYFDKIYRDKMSVEGLKRAKTFSWERTVDLMVKEILK